MQIANERKRGRNMIYVTGDTHANIDIGKLSTKRFPQQKILPKTTSSSFVVTLGWFGMVRPEKFTGKIGSPRRASRLCGLMETMKISTSCISSRW